MRRNLVIDNLRGLAMLGVVGIHVGSFVLSSATPRLDLFLLFEIFTRFAVPAFFFISGYGLFAGGALERPLDYVSFMRKRLVSVGVPYLVWSLFYIGLWQRHDIFHDGAFYPGVLLTKLFLGEGCYHIYFMVILLWFYITLPLWRRLVRLVDRKSTLGTAVCLAVLAGLQLWLYRWSAGFWIYPAWTAQYPLLVKMLNARVNYIPLFYGFVFVLGALGAIHEDRVKAWLKGHLLTAGVVFLAACGVMLRSFFSLWKSGTPLERVPEYLTQLTPEGLFYTVAWLMFFCALLEKLESRPLRFLKLLSAYSMVIYLIHPYFLSLIYSLFGVLGLAYFQVPVLLYYVLILLSSMAAGWVIQKAALRWRPVGILLLGRQPRR